MLSFVMCDFVPTGVMVLKHSVEANGRLVERFSLRYGPILTRKLSNNLNFKKRWENLQKCSITYRKIVTHFLLTQYISLA